MVVVVVCVCAVRNSEALIRCDNYWKGGGDEWLE